MIYVLAGDHRQFRNFCFEFMLREDGQVRYLADAQRALLGLDRAIVLCWGTWYERPDAREIEAHCAARDIPFIVVPDLRRARYFKEQFQRESPNR